MKSFCLFIFSSLVIFGFSTVHAGYRAPMTGATQTEREIRWLWKNLGELIRSCQAAKSVECKAPEFQSLITALTEYVPVDATTEWETLLQFVSEKDNKDLFKSGAGEAHRLVVTDTKKLSKVFVNTDRMEIPLEDWVGLLTHEAVHHLGIGDDATRTPDRMGAEVAKHFKKHIVYSSLEQFNSPLTKVLTFNSLAEGRASVGFWSWGEWTSDLFWGQEAFHQVCAPGERVKHQYVSAPSWRVNRFRYSLGIVSIRGGGFVRTECANSMGQTRVSTLPLAASIDLKFPLPFDLKNWMNQTPTLPYDGHELAPSMNENDAIWGQAQTFVVLSNKTEKTLLNAGEVFKVELVVRGLDDYKPVSCQLFIAGLEYSYLKRDTLPGVKPFEKCKLTAMTNNEWKLEGEIKIPSDARPDFYYVPMAFLSQSEEDLRTAAPTHPNLVQVVNPSAPAAPKASAIRILDLEETSRMGGLDLTHSYKTDAEKIFTVEFDVMGPQKISSLWLDVDLWYPDLKNKQFGVLSGTGSSISWKEVFLSDVVTPIPGGSRVTMKFKMPKSIQGIELAAIKFRRFYMKSSDFSWVEIEMPDFHSHFVINRRFEY